MCERIEGGEIILFAQCSSCLLHPKYMKKGLRKLVLYVDDVMTQKCCDVNRRLSIIIRIEYMNHCKK